MRPLRFGIVGCGGIAGLHGECLRALEGENLARLVAGAEAYAPSRERFAQQWQVEVHDSLDGMLARDDIDAIIVATPSGMHASNSIQIARSGRHVLCEKPLGLRLCEVDEAIATACAHGVVLGGVLQQRFAPAAQEVKRAVDAGYLGDIVLVHCETPWYRSQAYYDSADWRGTWAMDGGVLSNQAPHMIDRILWLGGDFGEVISATCETRARDIETETLAVATIRLANGALGTITGTTLAYEGLPQRAFICGTEGSAAFEGDDLVYFKTMRPFEAVTVVESHPMTHEKKSSNPLAMSNANHEANIRDFVLAIREGRPPLVTAQDGRRVVQVLNDIYAKAGVGPYGE